MKNHQLHMFLFSAVNPKPLIVFRILLAVMLGFMFLPQGLEPIYPLVDYPKITAFVLSNAYYVFIYILLFLFALGVNPRTIAFILFLTLLPHDFLSEGRKSKQVILCVLMCFVFLKTLPLWKFNTKIWKLKNLSPIWPIRLIQVQLSLVYGINALAKTTPYYLSGEALMDMSTAYENFHVDFSSGFYNIGFVEIPIALLAISSVLVEAFLAVGFWFKKTKWIAVTLGLSFHLYLTTIMTIFMLDYVCLFLYLAFIISFEYKPKNTVS